MESKVIELFDELGVKQHEDFTMDVNEVEVSGDKVYAMTYGMEYLYVASIIRPNSYTFSIGYDGKMPKTSDSRKNISEVMDNVKLWNDLVTKYANVKKLEAKI